MDDRTRHMYALYEAGLTLQAVGDLHGLTRQRVEQVFKKYGLKRRKPGRQVASKKTTVCPRCYGKYDPGTYKQHIKTLEHRVIWVDPRRDIVRERQIVDDYLSGMRVLEIGMKHNMPQPNIYRFLQAQGIEPNRGGVHYIRTPEIKARMKEAQRKRYASKA